MPSIFTKMVSSLPGIHIKSKSRYHDAVIAFDKVNTAPTSSGTTNAMLYVDSSGKLTFAYNGVGTIIGAPGAAATTWEALYANDATMALTTGAWTITQGGAFGALSLNKTNVGAGAVLTLANSGSGNDITGPAWSLISTGAVGILELASGGTINATGGALAIGLAGTATTLKGSLTVDQTATITGAVTATASVTVTGADGSNVLTVTAGDVVVSNGSVTVTDTDNAASLAVVNNTVTTFGSAAASGLVEFSSTSLTTGTLLHLELTEGTLNGGYYVRCWDVTAGAAVFSIAENGDMVVAGTAGSNALTLTAGDLLLSDGSVTVVDADNAASLSVTNDTATTASVVVVAGSGVFTGSTTSSFVTITPSGLTTGTGVYIPLAAMTTGTGINLVANSLTTGTGMTISSSGTITTTGELLSLVGNSATTCTGLLRASGTGLTDGFVAEFTGGGANASASGGVLNLAMGAATVGTGIKLVTSGVYTGTTGVLGITADSATTGIIAKISANGLTTGSALLVTSSGTVTSAGQGVVNVVASGMTTGSALKIDLTEATLTTGKYIECYDDTAAAAVFSVAKDGAVVIAGTAAETAALTITAGDLTLTSGLINLETGTGTANANAVTISKATGTITSSTNNLAAVTTETITLTNTRISATSHVVAWIEDEGTGGEVVVLSVKPGAGSATIRVRNVHASSAMTSVYRVGFTVINK
jgi:hypothetical protein